MSDIESYVSSVSDEGMGKVLLPATLLTHQSKASSSRTGGAGRQFLRERKSLPNWNRPFSFFFH